MSSSRYQSAALTVEQSQRLATFLAQASRNALPMIECFERELSRSTGGQSVKHPMNGSQRFNTLALFARVAKSVHQPEACPDIIRWLSSSAARVGLSASSSSAIRSAAIAALKQHGGVPWTSELETDWNAAINAWCSATFNTPVASGSPSSEHAASRRAA